METWVNPFSVVLDPCTKSAHSLVATVQPYTVLGNDPPHEYSLCTKQWNFPIFPPFLVRGRKCVDLPVKHLRFLEGSIGIGDQSTKPISRDAFHPVIRSWEKLPGDSRWDHRADRWTGERLGGGQWLYGFAVSGDVDVWSLVFFSFSERGRDKTQPSEP